MRDSGAMATTPHSVGRTGLILALLSFAMLIVSLDQYIVVVALPEIGRDLGYSAQTLQAVVTACAIASSGFLLFGVDHGDVVLGPRAYHWWPVRHASRLHDCLLHLTDADDPGGRFNIAGPLIAVPERQRPLCLAARKKFWPWMSH